MKKKIISIFITLILLFSIGVSRAYAASCISGVPALDADGKQVGCVTNNDYKKHKDRCLDGYRPVYKLLSNGMSEFQGRCVEEKKSTTTKKSTTKKSTKTTKSSKAGSVKKATTTSGDGTFKRYRWTNTLKTLKNKGLITYDWYLENGGNYSTQKAATALCANDPDKDNDGTKENSKVCRHNIYYWNLYYVVVGKTYYITYCINPSLSIKHMGAVKQYTSLDSMHFTDTTLTAEEKAKRVELIENLLFYGYNVSPANNHSPSWLVNTGDAHNYLKMIAMQVLVYEVVEGGRDSFDTIKPNVWGGRVQGEEGYDPDEDFSLYHQIIEPNGGDKADPKDTLYGYYKEIVENVRLADQHNPSTAFNERDYVMSWDSLNKRYIVTVKGLGDYKEECESDNPNVDMELDDTNGIVTLSSTEPITDAKITCRYGRGNGSTTETFRYFRFVSNADKMQDMLYGSGYKVYEDWFRVSTESSNVLIKKTDADNKAVSGAKFTLTHMTNLDYSVNVEGNGSAQTLILSGKYRISETTVPEDFDKINDFNITINAKTHKITNCDGQKTDDAGSVVSCLNNQVKVVYGNNNTIELTVVDMPKNFKIIKVNKDGTPITGAAFEIRDKNNNLIKFTLGVGNLYKYDTAGTITTISNPSLSSYAIASLPEGEYKIIETAAPASYRLPVDESARTTLIKINSNRELSVYDKTKKSYVPATTGTIRVVNYNTNISVHKTGNGKPLAGVQFELLNETKSVKIRATLGAPGRYTYAEDQTYEENTVYVTNSTGDIVINNVPEGTYYLKEIATVEPFVLPEGDGIYTKVKITVDENGVSVNGNYALSTIEISNTPNSFNFYKRDPQGNSLSGGKYKLQKYDKKTKKYVDVKISEVENDGTYADNADIYKEDEANGKIQFTLTNGIATFIDMQSATTYRIIELEAPAGFEKISADDTATVYIDEYGNASGLLVLVDPPLPDEDASAYAELIVNIQTGKQRIMYAAVIVIIISLIIGLIVFNKKKNK